MNRIFIVLVAMVSNFTFGQANSEKSNCDKCWKIYERSLRTNTRFAANASKSENGKAGGETAAYWNKRVRNTFANIAECCKDGEMEKRCRQLDDAQVQKLCLEQILPAEKKPKDPEDSQTNDDSPKERPPKESNQIDEKVPPSSSNGKPSLFAFKPLKNAEVIPLCNPQLPRWMQIYLDEVGVCQYVPPIVPPDPWWW